MAASTTIVTFGDYDEKSPKYHAISPTTAVINKRIFRIIMCKSNWESNVSGNYKNFPLDLYEELASQLYKSARDAGAPPEVIAAAILSSHVEKGPLDVSDLRDS